MSETDGRRAAGRWARRAAGRRHRDGGALAVEGTGEERRPGSPATSAQQCRSDARLVSPSVKSAKPSRRNPRSARASCDDSSSERRGSAHRPALRRQAREARAPSAVFIFLRAEAPQPRGGLARRLPRSRHSSARQHLSTIDTAAASTLSKCSRGRRDQGRPRLQPLSSSHVVTRTAPSPRRRDAASGASGVRSVRRAQFAPLVRGRFTGETAPPREDRRDGALGRRRPGGGRSLAADDSRSAGG